MELTATTTETPTEPTGPTPRRDEPSTFPSLGWLIGEARVRDFLDRRLGQEALRTHLAPDALRTLFSWPTLNAALAEHRLAPPRLHLERAGGDYSKGLFKERRSRRGSLLQDLDAAVLNARLREGATLILDAANELSPPLQRLCAGLAAEFACSCQANLYACWGTTQGFDVHWDDHDVFVLQVEGRKRWRLYGSTREAPTRRDLHADHPKPDEPLYETVLEPGDVLYMPRGYWHAAVGMGGPTMHLTVGLTRKTGADVLHWLADHLLNQGVVRRDLPLERDDQALGGRIAELLELAAASDPGELAGLYRRFVEAHQTHRPRLSFPLIGDEATVGPDTRLRLAEGVARLRRASPHAMVLSWRGTEYTVAAELEAQLSTLAMGGEISIGDLVTAVPERSRPLIQPFVAEMMGRGVLVVASGPPA